MVENTQAKLPHLESMWITSMRDYMALFNASFKLKDKYIPELQRVGDSYIMAHVLAHGKFSKSEIKRVNWCRLYLGLVTVADMVSAAGTHILRAVYRGNKEAINTTNRWHEVHQKRPNAES